MSDDAEVDDYRAAVAAEYGKWVAKGPIYHDGALAYVKGNAVPVSNVERYKYDEQGLVEPVHTDDDAPPSQPVSLDINADLNAQQVEPSTTEES